jgi:hypothetical protein
MFVPSLAPSNYNLISTHPAGYADRLFWRNYTAARLHGLWAALTGRRRELEPLALRMEGTSLKARRHAGVRLVPLHAIRGSESRSGDFDAALRPRHRRMHQRWMRLADGWLRGVVFEPVQLIQVGDDFYVRDGHHRLSIARATGQRYIDAEITVWEFGEVDAARRPSRAARLNFLNQRAPAFVF